MNDIFESIEKEDPNDKTWHRNIEKYGIQSFLQMNVKLSFSLWTLSQK